MKEKSVDYARLGWCCMVGVWLVYGWCMVGVLPVRIHRPTYPLTQYSRPD